MRLILLVGAYEVRVGLVVCVYRHDGGNATETWKRTHGL